MLNKSMLIKLACVIATLGLSLPASSWDGGDLTDIYYTSSGSADLFGSYTTTTWDGTVNYAGIYQENGDYGDIGGWNVARIDQTDGIGHLAMIWQSGANNYAFITQGGGDANQARISQVGDNHFANVVQSGSNNVVSLVQVGSLNDPNVSQFPTLDGSNTQYDGNTYATIALVTQIGTNNYLSAKLNVGSVLNATQTGTGNSLSLVLAPGTFVGVSQGN